MDRLENFEKALKGMIITIFKRYDLIDDNKGEKDE